MNKPNYAILRVAKIHTRRQLQAAADHNNRTETRGLEHTDANRGAGVILGRADALNAWDDAMKAKGLEPKPAQKGGVIALEWVASASPDWWETADADRRARWAADSVAFIEKQAGGRENVLAVWWHDDETTPHIHALTIPLVEKERKARGRVRAGRERPAPTKGWGLSAKDLIGGTSDRLRLLQDDYAIEMSRHRLARGVPRKEKGERNKAPAHWRAEQARLTDQMHGDAKVITSARKSADLYREAAIAHANELMEKAAAAFGYAQELGRRVRADAKYLGQAISFTSYEDNPESAEARAAVEAARKKKDDEIEAQKRLNAKFWGRLPTTRKGPQAGQERVRER